LLFGARERLFGATLLLPGCLALRLLVLLHCFPLLPGSLLYGFFVLLGGLPGFAAIFSDTGVFPLSCGWYRGSNAQSDQNQEGRDTLHNVSEWNIQQRF
jgi:hypothetical protein